MWNWLRVQLRQAGIFWIIIVFVMTGCATSRLSPTQFSQVKEGMTEDEVIAILGEPTDLKSLGIGSVFGLSNKLSGTNMVWQNSEVTITIQFFNGQVKSKTYLSR